MKRSVIPAACLPFLFLANAHVSAQTRIALTGGFSRTSTEEFVPSVSALGEPTARPSIGLSAIVPLPRSLSLELGGAYSERGRELAYIQPCGTPLELPWKGQSVTMKHLKFKALGRVDLPLAGNRVLAFVTVGPTMAWELSCRSSPTTVSKIDQKIARDGSGSRSCGGIAELDLDKLGFGLAGGMGLEVGVTGRLGLTFSTVYNRGLRDLHRVEDYSMELRTVTVRGGLVYRID
ncbi:MAG: hypothetical protein OXU64_04555 [Gemmatimonadota bacterium]|nr:hypothetical protein [Gemmatimonadota bacterium]